MRVTKLAVLAVREGKLLLVDKDGWFTPPSRRLREGDDESSAMREELVLELGDEVVLEDSRFFKQYDYRKSVRDPVELSIRSFMVSLKGRVHATEEIVDSVWLSRGELENMRYPVPFHWQRILDDVKSYFAEEERKASELGVPEQSR